MNTQHPSFNENLPQPNNSNAKSRKEKFVFTIIFFLFQFSDVIFLVYSASRLFQTALVLYM